MKVFIANNTYSGHYGSKASIASLISQIEKHHEIVGYHGVREESIVCKKEWDEADALVVNGEGTIHQANKVRSDFLMQLLRRAQKEGKKTYLVNTVFQHEPPYFRDVLTSLDFFSVREIRSFESAKECGEAPEILLDAVLNPAVWQDGRKLGDLKGRVVQGDTWWGGFFFDYKHLSLWRIPFADMVETLKT